MNQQEEDLFCLFVSQKMGDLMVNMLKGKELNYSDCLATVSANVYISTLSQAENNVDDFQRFIDEEQANLNEAFEKLRAFKKLEPAKLDTINLDVKVRTSDVKKIVVGAKETIVIKVNKTLDANSAKIIGEELMKRFGTSKVLVTDESFEVSKSEN